MGGVTDAMVDRAMEAIKTVREWSPEIKDDYLRKIAIAALSAQPRPDATFVEWLATEMPAGTIIGDPVWWANRIARQYAVRSSQPASAPVGVEQAVAIIDRMPDLQRLLELRQYNDTDGPMEVMVGTDLIDAAMYEIRDTICRVAVGNPVGMTLAQQPAVGPKEVSLDPKLLSTAINLAQTEFKAASLVPGNEQLAAASAYTYALLVKGTGMKAAAQPAPSAPVGVGRVGKTQAAIIEAMRKQGGAHVYIGAGMTVFGTSLAGYTAEEVERALAGLVKRGIVIEVKHGFYTLPESALAQQPAPDAPVGAYEILALALDEQGHHTEADNVRKGIDLQVNRTELRAVRIALAQQPAAECQHDWAGIILSGEHGRVYAQECHACGHLRADPEGTKEAQQPAACDASVALRSIYDLLRVNTESDAGAEIARLHIIEAESKQPAAVDEAAIPTAREVARIGDMDQRAALRVGFDGDNDVYLSTTNGAGEGVEFCTTGNGGGKSPRTRDALVALMVAMEADNTADPSRDWWARRNAAPLAQPQGEG